MWKGNGNTTTSLFSLKVVEILHLERRGQVKTIVMEQFSVNLFHNSGSANQQHTNQPTVYLHEGYEYSSLMDINIDFTQSNNILHPTLE